MNGFSSCILPEDVDRLIAEGEELAPDGEDSQDKANFRLIGEMH